jgi:hypothetical protein
MRNYRIRFQVNSIVDSLSKHSDASFQTITDRADPYSRIRYSRGLSLRGKLTPDRLGYALVVDDAWVIGGSAQNGDDKQVIDDARFCFYVGELPQEWREHWIKFGFGEKDSIGGLDIDGYRCLVTIAVDEVEIREIRRILFEKVLRHSFLYR